MKTIASVIACFCLLSTGFALAQGDADICHVYVVDVKSTQTFREKTDLKEFMAKSTSEQEALMKAAGLGKTYEKFHAKVAEEELTTKTYSYPFPKRNQVITASVFYTDESMASTAHQSSMLLAISVATKATDDALSASDAAITEISYDDHADTVRVKKNVLVDGRLFLVGLECRCKKAKPEKEK